MLTVKNSYILNLKLGKYIFFSIFSVFYIDYLAKTSLGSFISIILFFLLIVSAFYFPLKSFKYFIILYATIPSVPRNILDVYDSLQITGDVSYNTLTSLPLAGISLIQYLTAFYIIYWIYLIGKNRIKITTTYVVITFFLIIFPLVISVFYLLKEPETFLIREIVTAMRFPLYLTLGILFCLLYKNRPMVIRNFLIETVFAISIIYCVRVPFFLILTLFESTPSLEFGVVPGIPYAVIFSLLLLHIKNNKIRWIIVVLCFSILSPSRGQIFNFFFNIFIYLIVANFSIKKIKFVFGIIFSGFLLLTITSFFNERMYEFFLWKLSEFSFSSDRLSASGLVRVYEFLNIFDAYRSDFGGWLFGKGLSGYFTYDAYPYPFPELLDLKSYSASELQSELYYHPHFFTSFLWLKFGLIGLIFYVLFIFKFFFMCKKQAKLTYPMDDKFLMYFGLFLSFALLTGMFFRGYYAILFPLLFEYVRLKNKYNENSFSVS